MPIIFVACLLANLAAEGNNSTAAPPLSLAEEDARLRSDMGRRLAGSFRLKHWRSKRKGVAVDGQTNNLRGVEHIADAATLDQIAKRARKSLHYWRTNQSPTLTLSKQQQYIAFEPDFGGFNNIRLALETVVILAHATGRAIILPPKQGMYLLHTFGQKSLLDFFDLTDLQKLVPVLSAEEFVRVEGIEDSSLLLQSFEGSNWNPGSALGFNRWMNDAAHAKALCWNGLRYVC
jgi:hypothetical protein